MSKTKEVPQEVIADIKNNKMREGNLFQRSKFLHEWKKRFVVLTSEYFYCFSDDNMTELKDVIKLKKIKYYKSYVNKDEKIYPATFVLHTTNLEDFYFSGKTCNEKWSWMVTI